MRQIRQIKEQGSTPLQVVFLKCILQLCFDWIENKVLECPALRIDDASDEVVRLVHGQVTPH